MVLLVFVSALAAAGLRSVLVRLGIGLELIGLRIALGLVVLVVLARVGLETAPVLVLLLLLLCLRSVVRLLRHLGQFGIVGLGQRFVAVLVMIITGRLLLRRFQVLGSERMWDMGTLLVLQARFLVLWLFQSQLVL